LGKAGALLVEDIEDVVGEIQTCFNIGAENPTQPIPKTCIVICEPFALRCGAVKNSWFPEFDERKAAAKRVAESAGVLWAPFPEAFDEAVNAGSKPDYWAADGVHPSMADHVLMAKVWSETTGLR